MAEFIDANRDAYGGRADLRGVADRPVHLSRAQGPAGGSHRSCSSPRSRRPAATSRPVRGVVTLAWRPGRCPSTPRQTVDGPWRATIGRRLAERHPSSRPASPARAAKRPAPARRAHSAWRRPRHGRWADAPVGRRPAASGRLDHHQRFRIRGTVLRGPERVPGRLELGLRPCEHRARRYLAHHHGSSVGRRDGDAGTHSRRVCLEDHGDQARRAAVAPLCAGRSGRRPPARRARRARTPRPARRRPRVQPSPRGPRQSRPAARQGWVSGPPPGLRARAAPRRGPGSACARRRPDPE